MTECSSCSAPVADDARFCASCGTPVDASSAGTVHRGDRAPSSGSIDHGRFVPGTMFGTRYRIVALLGRGGMGEVFRADDLKLGQPVALKLLPKELAAREDRRARLLGEVRIARQIAHPNVCRVYDVGEIDGEHFITMEYVTGEDLASLLQRIGRLPKDKGLEIARQICAGLAAAHERGILHRDLKPANVMLDERGKVRITDFGLAALAADASTNAAEGTPAYMAPEQLAGREATARSDIYALGLVLYELFTGKRAFSASSVAEMREMRAQKSVTDPSRIVEDIDPAVERVILRCLENDPRDRPPSVVAVAAALPGGDPLAAALAAGETPSPELLAAAGDNVGLRPAIALPLLLFILVGAVAALMAMRQHHIVGLVDLSLPPDALELKASEVLRSLGYAGKPRDSERGFATSNAYMQYAAREDQSGARWKRMRDEQPSPVSLWYREADQPLEWTDFFQGMVTRFDPPPLRGGMKMVEVDSAGRLIHLRVVPDHVAAESPAPIPSTDWDALFDAAGLDRAAFRPVASQWNPPVYADARAAWEGTSTAGRPLRIEAASLRGRPVYFQLVGPWTRAEQARETGGVISKTGQAVQIAIFAVIVIGSILMAHRNLRLGRGDRRGAGRLAMFMFVLSFLVNLFHATHTPTSYELGILVISVSWGLFFGGLAWLMYLALEPFVRRRWPHVLIAWGKVMAGRIRDPLVGRDVLIGTAAGIGLMIGWELTLLAARAMGTPPARPAPFGNQLSDITHTFDTILSAILEGVTIALAVMFLLFLARTLVRIEALAMAIVIAIGITLNTVTQGPFVGSVVVGAVMGALGWTTLLLTIAKRGALAGACVVFVSGVLGTAVPAPLGAWYGYAMWAPLALVAVIAIFAFYTALAGRPIFREALLET